MKLPHGWRQPIHIADAGGRGPVDSRAALADTQNSNGMLGQILKAVIENSPHRRRLTLGL